VRDAPEVRKVREGRDALEVRKVRKVREVLVLVRQVLVRVRRSRRAVAALMNGAATV
jgi:hypothetical protein